MPQFSYKARRRSGELVEGVLEVADRPAALVQIQRLGLFPIAVDTAKGGAAANGQPRDGKKRGFAGVPAAGGARATAKETQTEVAGTGDVHPATGEPAQLRHAADGGAQQHDPSGVQGHSRRGEPRFETGSLRGPRVCRTRWRGSRAFFRICMSTWCAPASKAVRWWKSCGAWRTISSSLPRCRPSSLRR